MGWAIIVLCVVVYIWQAGHDFRDGLIIAHQYGFIPAVVFGDVRLAPDLAAIPADLTALSYQFLHGGTWHLIGNMLFLYIFGDNVEDCMGHLRFLAFYLLSGAAGAAAHGFAMPGSEAPLIGASAAISGILGAYVMLHPRARITALVVIFPLRLPVWLWVGGWFLFQLLASGGLMGADEVAYLAHLGGFVAGLALTPFLKRSEARLFAD